MPAEIWWKMFRSATDSSVASVAKNALPAPRAVLSPDAPMAVYWALVAWAFCCSAALRRTSRRTAR
ncbi:MAG: hypothetical protein ACXW4S_05395 [Candidatus Deferrimicrobiaceae bacterium]